MHAVIVTFEVLPEKVDLFRDAILANAAISLETEPGCVTFDVLKSPTAPQFMLYEIYRNADAFQLHLGMSHFHDFDRISTDWVVSKKVEEFGRINNVT
ncbi:antibiotic biosynthesis monooxygenase [Cupriavidus sp. P-10]|uniref:putative quinol monooxygenase n=1 Tax=Cupriavidus sp. P-10 TaxID=2027911 RepID=UPI000E2FCC63|nr:putative quinol monooxygenase [Cupriavidus sp. P-10]BDB27245.1 antibiotic biosynthesis monooxygenase [Cupriavidus sp. P-10]